MVVQAWLVTKANLLICLFITMLPSELCQETYQVRGVGTSQPNRQFSFTCKSMHLLDALHDVPTIIAIPFPTLKTFKDSLFKTCSGKPWSKVGNNYTQL